MAQRLATALGHDLDRQAAVEIGRGGFPIVERCLFAGEQRIDEGVILFAGERAIDVVGARTAGPGLVVARLEPGDVKVDAVAMDDRRDGVEEGERVFAGEPADGGGEIGRGKRSGGDDDAVPVGRRQRDLAARERDQRMGFQRRRHRGGKAVAVDRQRAARRDLVAIRRAHDERAEPAHLLMQQADGIVRGVVGAERIGADQLGIAVGLVRGGRPLRPHLVQRDRHAGLRELPGGLRAGEAAADDMDRFHGDLKLGAGHRCRNHAPETQKRPPGGGRFRTVVEPTLSACAPQSRRPAGCPSG